MRDAWSHEVKKKAPCTPQQNPLKPQALAGCVDGWSWKRVLHTRPGCNQRRPSPGQRSWRSVRPWRSGLCWRSWRSWRSQSRCTGNDWNTKNTGIAGTVKTGEPERPERPGSKSNSSLSEACSTHTHLRGHSKALPFLSFWRWNTLSWNKNRPT